jgi:hypothetical protein
MSALGGVDPGQSGISDADGALKGCASVLKTSRQKEKDF